MNTKKKIITIKNIVKSIEQNISSLSDEKTYIINQNKIINKVIKNKIGIKQKSYIATIRENNLTKKK